ncbi:AAA family ATPase [Nitrosovibrio sp. Nv4]|uniref:AAA family ATPase n=1 Tax=Nitrosovibrio sp. Nv4 TaxID=1945880 RepID=UPI000BC3753F|nr:AAA family ATPase [Nitrosovibrio sp. Nv4]SOD42601.1 AAA domain-containing protein [Nitrosovibrio sp. Nv4]
MNAAGKVISSQEWRKLSEVEQKKCIADYIPRGLEGCADLELIEMPRLVVNGKRVKWHSQQDSITGREPERLEFQTAADLLAMPPAQYLVKRILPQNGLVPIFGPPSSGKSFLALELAFAISEGRPFYGHRTLQRDAVYLCLEGQGGLAQRVRAYYEYYRDEAIEPTVQFVKGSFSLFSPHDVEVFIEKVNNLHSDNYCPGIIMIDTLSAAAAGADENSSPDMGRIVDTLHRIGEECDCVVIPIHHSGKDASRGMRGHSSLLAASDAVIEVRREDDRRSWRLAKSKDGVDGEEHAFRLSSVELGTDTDGDPITSCIITPEERTADSVRRVKLPKGGNQKVVYDVAGELLRASNDFAKGGAPNGRPCTRVDELIEACRGRLAVENDRVPERVRIAVTGLVNAGCLILREGWIWIR